MYARVGSLGSVVCWISVLLFVLGSGVCVSVLWLVLAWLKAIAMWVCSARLEQPPPTRPSAYGQREAKWLGEETES